MQSCQLLLHRYMPVKRHIVTVVAASTDAATPRHSKGETGCQPQHRAWGFGVCGGAVVLLHKVHMQKTA